MNMIKKLFGSGEIVHSAAPPPEVQEKTSIASRVADSGSKLMSKFMESRASQIIVNALPATVKIGADVAVSLMPSLKLVAAVEITKLINSGIVVPITQKISGQTERHLSDLESGLKKLRLNMGENEYAEVYEFSNFCTNITVNPIFKKEGFLIESLITFLNKMGISEEAVSGIIQSNLMNVLKNLLKHVSIEDQEDAPGLKDNPRLLGYLKSAFTKIFTPFAEEYGRKTEGIKDAEYQVEKALAKVLSFEEIKLTEFEFFRRRSNPVLARIKIAEILKDGSKDSLKNLKEIKQVLINNISEKIVEIKHIDSKSSKDKSTEIRDARNALEELSAEIEVIDALLKEDVSLLNKFKRESDLIEIQLATLSTLESKDPSSIKEAQETARADLKTAQELLEEQLKSRKDFVIERVAPEFLKAFFPEGSQSLFIYHKYLPVSPLQKIIWSLIEKKFPVYFEQIMPFLLLLDAREQQEILDKNPAAASIKEGIDYFSDDLLNLAMNGLDVSESLKISLKRFLTPYVKHLATRSVNNSKFDKNTFVGLIELISNIKTSSPTEEDLENPETALKNEYRLLYPHVPVDESYANLLRELELPPEITPEQIKSLLRLNLKVVHEAKNLIVAEEAVKEVFKLLHIGNFENIGLPAIADAPIRNLLIKKLSELIAGKLFPAKINLREMKVVQLENDAVAGTVLKVSTLKAAIPAIIHFQLENMLNVDLRTDNGFSEIVNALSKGLGGPLKGLGKKSTFLDFLSNQIQEGNLNQLVENAIGLIDTNGSSGDSFSKDVAYGAKIRAVQLINPLLVNLAVKALTPILEKEKNGGVEFYQTLLMRVLPILTEYLTGLNNPTTNILGDNSISKEAFYRGSSARLLDFFLPKKIESLKELFPHLNDQELNKAWSLLSSKLPGILGQLKDPIFKKSIIRDPLIEVYKGCIAAFKDLTVKAPKPPEAPLVLTPAEIALQSQMEKELMDFAYQAARLTDLPVDKLLKMVSYLPGHRKVLDIIVKSTCVAIQKQFNGKVIAESIEKGLKGQINKIKPKEIKSEAEKDLQFDQLEKELIESIFPFAIRSIDEKVRTSLKMFDYLVVKQIKDLLFFITKLFVSKILGGLFYLFGFQTKFVDKSHRMLHRNRVNLQNGFAQPQKHEGVVLDMIQAGINVLEAEWRGAPVLVG